MANQDYASLLHQSTTVPLTAPLTLRDLLLPDLLGEETHAILYWAGRNLARKLPVQESDLPAAFAELGFGELQAGKAKRQVRLFTLGGPVVAARLTANTDADFRLEAGFIAQSLQQQFGAVVEADVAEPHRDTVTITCVLDPKDPQGAITDFLEF